MKVTIQWRRHQKVSTLWAQVQWLVKKGFSVDLDQEKGTLVAEIHPLYIADKCGTVGPIKPEGPF